MTVRQRLCALAVWVYVHDSGGETVVVIGSLWQFQLPTAATGRNKLAESKGVAMIFGLSSIPQRS